MEDKLINRIQKMLALAHDKAATEGERDTALSMVYKLLAKHNLTMADVGKGGEQRVQASELFYGRPWATQVCLTVGQLFFCEYFLVRSSVKNMSHHYFVGKESNTTTALGMSKFLIESIRKEARRRQRERSENTTWNRSFCLGASFRLYRRVKELRAIEEQVATPGTALVLANIYDTERLANQEYLKSTGVVIKQGRKNNFKIRGDGYSDGMRFGDTLNFQIQVF